MKHCGLQEMEEPEVGKSWGLRVTVLPGQRLRCSQYLDSLVDHINKGDFTRAKDYHKQDYLLKYEF